jgi:demethylmenaquinone methyltransferase/2-methoxy-6-polyprenyl-1,4-benzoquinol methylase
MVRRVFRRPPRYDLMNDLMSGGVPPLENALVVRTRGRAKVPRRRRQHRRRRLSHPTTPGDRPDVTVCDISSRWRSGATAPPIAAAEGSHLDDRDAESLPFPDRSFDGYTIAFGLRNVTDIDKALAEAHRVLKPGGRFYCLEFSKVTSALLGRVYDAYSSRALPFLGRVIARDAESYRYHEASGASPQRELAQRRAGRFPHQRRLARHDAQC